DNCVTMSTPDIPAVVKPRRADDIPISSSSDTPRTYSGTGHKPEAAHLTLCVILSHKILHHPQEPRRRVQSYKGLQTTASTTRLGRQYTRKNNYLTGFRHTENAEASPRTGLHPEKMTNTLSAQPPASTPPPKIRVIFGS